MCLQNKAITAVSRSRYLFFFCLSSITNKTFTFYLQCELIWQTWWNSVVSVFLVNCYNAAFRILAVDSKHMGEHMPSMHGAWILIIIANTGPFWPKLASAWERELLPMDMCLLRMETVIIRLFTSNMFSNEIMKIYFYNPYLGFIFSCTCLHFYMSGLGFLK